MSFVARIISTILPFVGRMVQADPVAAAALLVFGVLGWSLVPIALLAPLYWLAWWVLLGCLAVAAHQGRSLGTGGALSAALAALLAPKRAAASGGGSGVQPGGEVQASSGAGVRPRSEAAARLRDALRSYVQHEEAPAAPGGPQVSVSWTGQRVSPEERRARELEVLAALEQRLRERVHGQDHVARAIARHLLRQAAGVRERRQRPLLSALFAGPTGTGKTETAKALAEALGRPLLVYDMANFAQEHTVAALIGSPPGYIGSDRPGRLVADLQRYPNAVVLLDEVEKAHPRLYDPLLAVLDEGRLKELSRGDVADCSDSIWIMTTNLLAREARQEWTDDPAVVRKMLLDAGFLRPELINRIDLVMVFRPLSREVLEGIARSYIAAYAQQVAVNQGLPALAVEIDEAVVDAVLERCDLAFGARDLKRAVDGLVGDALVEGYIPWLGRPDKPSRLSIALASGRVVAEYAA